MITDIESCRRIGLVYKSSYTQEYMALVKAIVYWRTNMTLEGRRLWWDTVEDRERTYNHQKILVIDPDWHALKQKKQGIFGYGYSKTLSPIQGYRHPWVMTQAEFKEAYARIMEGKEPTDTIPDTRWRVPNLLSNVSAVLSNAQQIAETTGFLEKAGPLLKLISPIKYFEWAATITGWEQDAFDAIEKYRFSGELASLKRQYDLEKTYRDKGF